MIQRPAVMGMTAVRSNWAFHIDLRCNDIHYLCRIRRCDNNRTLHHTEVYARCTRNEHSMCTRWAHREENSYGLSTD
jgi:hypothetical protein